jgi:hypothetical protein
MVQNATPNITPQTLRTLNIDISRLVRSAAHRTAARSASSTARNAAPPAVA